MTSSLSNKRHWVQKQNLLFELKRSITKFLTMLFRRLNLTPVWKQTLTVDYSPICKKRKEEKNIMGVAAF